MAKGSAFERSVCKLLSLWWTSGSDDSCFWRTSMSGGRATIRNRKGKRTRGQAGDICATDKKGSQLTTKITFELKKGYNRATIAELLDRPGNLKDQTFEAWIKQAEASRKLAATPWWMIIHQRDRRLPVVYFPRSLWVALFQSETLLPKPVPFAEFKLYTDNKKARIIYCMPMQHFLNTVSPIMLRAL